MLQQPTLSDSETFLNQLKSQKTFLEEAKKKLEALLIPESTLFNAAWALIGRQSNVSDTEVEDYIRSAEDKITKLTVMIESFREAELDINIIKNLREQLISFNRDEVIPVKTPAIDADSKKTAIKNFINKEKELKSLLNDNTIEKIQKDIEDEKIKKQSQQDYEKFLDYIVEKETNTPGFTKILQEFKSSHKQAFQSLTYDQRISEIDPKLTTQLESYWNSFQQANHLFDTSKTFIQSNMQNRFAKGRPIFLQINELIDLKSSIDENAEVIEKVKKIPMEHAYFESCQQLLRPNKKFDEASYLQDFREWVDNKNLIALSNEKNPAQYAMDLSTQVTDFKQWSISYNNIINDLKIVTLPTNDALSTQMLQILNQQVFNIKKQEYTAAIENFITLNPKLSDDITQVLTKHVADIKQLDDVSKVQEKCKDFTDTIQSFKTDSIWDLIDKTLYNELIVPFVNSLPAFLNIEKKQEKKFSILEQDKAFLPARNKALLDLAVIQVDVNKKIFKKQ